MSGRASLTCSAVLHGAALAALWVSGFTAPRRATPPVGMELELVDMHEALPSPESFRVPRASSASAAPASAPPSASEATPLAAVPAPAQNTASLPASPARMMAPAPVAPVSVQPAPAAVTAPPAPPAPPRPRFDAGRVAGLLAAAPGPTAPSRVNSAAIGSAIGRAAPKGVAGLSLRQRAQLIDLIRAQVTPCWNPPPAAEDTGHVTVVMRIALDRAGQVIGVPAVGALPGQTAANAVYARTLAGSVRRAVLRCAPLRLPSELYDAWADVELSFDPRDAS